MSNNSKCKKEIVYSGLIPEAYIEEATDALSKYDKLEEEIKKRNEANQKASSFLEINKVYFRPSFNF